MTSHSEPQDPIAAFHQLDGELARVSAQLDSAQTAFEPLRSAEEQARQGLYSAEWKLSDLERTQRRLESESSVKALVTLRFKDLHSQRSKVEADLVLVAANVKQARQVLTTAEQAAAAPGRRVQELQAQRAKLRDERTHALEAALRQSGSPAADLLAAIDARLGELDEADEAAYDAYNAGAFDELQRTQDARRARASKSATALGAPGLSTGVNVAGILLGGVDTGLFNVGVSVGGVTLGTAGPGIAQQSSSPNLDSSFPVRDIDADIEWDELTQRRTELLEAFAEVLTGQAPVNTAAADRPVNVNAQARARGREANGI